MDLKEKISERRHDEIMSATKTVEFAVKALNQKDNNELKALLAQNKEAIVAFVKATGSIKPAETFPADAFATMNKIAKQLGEILNGIDSRLELLENRPLATKLKAERNQYSNEIEYITIEYKK